MFSKDDETKCCWKCAVLLKLRLFPHSFSLRHTPYDNEKKSWLDGEVKSRKRYALLLNLAQGWRGGSVRQKEIEEIVHLVSCSRPKGEFSFLCSLTLCRISKVHYFFILQWNSFLGKPTNSSSCFLHSVINFIYFAHVSVVIPQLGGHRDRVLFLGNLTPIPLHFQRNWRPEFTYLSAVCHSCLWSLYKLSGLVGAKCKCGTRASP